MQKGNFLSFITFLIISPIFIGTVLASTYLISLLSSLPDVHNIGKSITQSTVILDREGNEMYRLFQDENRQYIKIADVSKNFLNAIISIEDKRFYTHPGVDFSGLVRAMTSNIKGNSVQGASTITQQLVKNSVLKNNERTFDRKIKEALLAYLVERSYTKDQILELYVNQISFGGNANGIELASMTYFGKHASEISVAESAVLASLPKGPTYYSPFGENKNLLLGYCKSSNGGINTGDADAAPGIDTKASITTSDTLEVSVVAQEKVWVKITPDSGKAKESTLAKGDTLELSAKDSFSISSGNKSFDLFVGGVKIKTQKGNTFTIAKKDLSDLYENGPESAQNTTVISSSIGGCASMDDPKYVKGRKDDVLKRMEEEGYITKEQKQQAWTESHTLVFKQNKEKIVHPHFVMYVREYLEKKYGENVGSKGYIVKTTLDPKLQGIAEKVVRDYGQKNEANKGVKNAALVSLDPNNGQVLAMVGSRDYWDTANDGNVNVTTRRRQPGSSFKPFIYAALFGGKWGAGSVLWDVSLKIGSKSPQDYDGMFKGPMMIRNALAYSRNIPPIKAYFLAGEDDKILDFLDKMGFAYLKDDRDAQNEGKPQEEWFNYGYPIAIGAGETKPIDMAAGYSIFADGGIYHAPNPIMEIVNRDGEVIEQWEQDLEETKVLDPQIAYQITDILSDPTARPESPYWRNILTIPGQVVAAKTGTSNKRFGSSIYPSDLWTVGYSRYMTTAVWAGNNDGSALSQRAEGLTEASPLWKEFMVQAHADREKKEFDEPKGLVRVAVSTLSGKRASKETPPGYSKVGLFSSWSVPTEYDGGHKVTRIDKRNGKLATDDCPDAVVDELISFNVHSEKPNVPAWENPVLAWAASKGFASGEVIDIPTETSELCKKTADGKEISVSFVQPVSGGTIAPGKATLVVSVNAPIGIAKVEYYVDGTLQDTRSTAPYTQGSVVIPNDTKKHILKVIAYDTNFFTSEESLSVSVKADSNGPTISFVSPASGTSFALGSTVKIDIAASDAESSVKQVDLYFDDTLIKSFPLKPYVFSLKLNGSAYTTGSHTLKAFAQDAKGNSKSSSISIKVTGTDVVKPAADAEPPITLSDTAKILVHE